MSKGAVSFHQHFMNLRDPRPHPSRHTYRFLDLLFMAFCATIAGADDWVAIATFARNRRDWLCKYCRLPGDGSTPSHDTFERLFKRLDPRWFGRCFARWTAVLAQELGLEHIAIDGKTLRGSARHDLRALHLVSAWATENHLSLGQVPVATKSNEITAIPKLLELLELEGALVTIDAMGCQKGIAKKIVEGGADYILEAKSNQPHLRDDIATKIESAQVNDFPGANYDTYQTEEKGHGRVEKRTYIIIYDTDGIRDKAKWEKLSAVGMCVRERLEKGEKSVEKHFFITSVVLSARDYAQALRGHWGIENNLPWQRDVCFGEDGNRVADRNAAENLALVRRMAVAHLKRFKAKSSMKDKRYSAALNVDILEEILNPG
jgi:predicted transposase YbfD/YdcC